MKLDSFLGKDEYPTCFKKVAIDHVIREGLFALENFEPQDFLLEYKGCRQRDTGCPKNEPICQEDKC